MSTPESPQTAPPPSAPQSPEHTEQTIGVNQDHPTTQIPFVSASHGLNHRYLLLFNPIISQDENDDNDDVDSALGDGAR